MRWFLVFIRIYIYALNLNINVVRNSNQTSLMRNVVSAGICIVIVMLFFFSCNNSEKKGHKIEDFGTVQVKDGKGNTDSIEYMCLSCDSLLGSKFLFDRILEEAGNKTKKNLNYPLSFNPERISIYINTADSLWDFETGGKIDSVLKISYHYEYIAKNGYGNELEGKDFNSFYIKDGHVVELEEKAKLKPLKFEDEFVNRSLHLNSLNSNEFISIMPMKDKSLIVNSSIRCVDEDAWLLITLENDTEIKLVSWNRFNCEGNAYFYPFNSSQKAKLKQSKIKYVSLASKGVVTCRVPKNQSDYFEQLIEL